MCMYLSRNTYMHIPGMYEHLSGHHYVHNVCVLVQEHESREREWELKVRGQQHEIDMLEAQKRTLVEKCEFIQVSRRDKSTEKNLPLFLFFLCLFVILR